MNHTKTRLTTRATSSGDVLNLAAPTSWEELSEEQFRYILLMMVMGIDVERLMILCFIRFTGIFIKRRTMDGYVCEHGKLKFILEAWQIAEFANQFGFLRHPERCRRCLGEIGDGKAPDVDLHGVDFRTYLTAENLYQAVAVSAQGGELSEDDKSILDEMVRIVYSTSQEGEFSDVERLSVFLWWTYIKSYFREMFPRLFRPGNPTGNYDPMAAMNAQVRALTDGDITKEEMVFTSDVWRALTELEAKMKEIDMIKSKR